MKVASFEQLKTMLKSASFTLLQNIARVKNTANQAQNTADSAKKAADIAKDTAKNKMDQENPQGTGYIAMNWEMNNSSVSPGKFSHSVNYGRATGDYAHAEGNARATAYTAHAEGNGEASGMYSHSEGSGVASGGYSHAEGTTTQSKGSSAHAEGHSSEAIGSFSHAEGHETIAQYKNQHVQGVLNDPGPKTKAEDNIHYDVSDGLYAHVIGNGYVYTDENGATRIKRSNAHTVDWNGNAWYAGSVEGTAMILKSTTENSAKRFRITVDDTGTLSATEITE